MGLSSKLRIGNSRQRECNFLKLKTGHKTHIENLPFGDPEVTDARALKEQARSCLGMKCYSHMTSMAKSLEGINRL